MKLKPINLILLLFILFSVSILSKHSQNKIQIEEVYGPFTEKESKEIEEISSKIVKFAGLAFTGKTKNSLQENDTNDFLAIEHKAHEDNFICKSCLWTFTKFHNFLRKRYGVFIIRHILALFCTIHEQHSVCLAAIDLYEPMVTNALIDHYFNAEYICSFKIICKYNHFEYLTADNYAKELLKDKPVIQKVEPKQQGPSLKVLHVTDIHTDLEYSEVKLS